MMKEYIYILAIATTLIVVQLQISDPSYAFVDRYIIVQTTATTHGCLKRKTPI